LRLIARAVVAPPDPIRRLSTVPETREPIDAALASCDGDVTKAAVLLGCARRTLQNRMRALGIPPGTPGRRHKIAR
jgi:DNA-binding NtrC family response regulator